MVDIDNGQCGKCQHYGQNDQSNQIIEIRIKGVAPDGFTSVCGHPRNADIHLSVSANSGCDGFSPAEAA